jgi:hypothetical protein
VSYTAAEMKPSGGRTPMSIRSWSPRICGSKRARFRQQPKASAFKRHVQTIRTNSIVRSPMILSGKIEAHRRNAQEHLPQGSRGKDLFSMRSGFLNGHTLSDGDANGDARASCLGNRDHLGF